MQEMKQEESGSLGRRRKYFLCFERWTRLRGEGETMAPDGGSGNDGGTAWGTARRIHGSNAESKCGL